jgi:hypothetical protein
MKNRILAMPAAVPAIPPKPSAAAIRANTKNTSAQPSIIAPYVCSLVSPQEEQERCHLPFRPSQHARSALCVSDQRHHAGARSGEIRSQHRRFLARSRAATPLRVNLRRCFRQDSEGLEILSLIHDNMMDTVLPANCPLPRGRMGLPGRRPPYALRWAGCHKRLLRTTHLQTPRCPARRAARQEDEAIVQAPMACLPALSAAAPA